MKLAILASLLVSASAFSIKTSDIAKVGFRDEIGRNTSSGRLLRYCTSLGGETRAESVIVIPYLLILGDPIVELTRHSFAELPALPAYQYFPFETTKKMPEKCYDTLLRVFQGRVSRVVLFISVFLVIYFLSKHHLFCVFATWKTYRSQS